MNTYDKIAEKIKSYRRNPGLLEPHGHIYIVGMMHMALDLKEISQDQHEQLSFLLIEAIEFLEKK